MLRLYRKGRNLSTHITDSGGRNGMEFASVIFLPYCKFFEYMNWVLYTTWEIPQQVNKLRKKDCSGVELRLSHLCVSLDKSPTFDFFHL